MAVFLLNGIDGLYDRDPRTQCKADREFRRNVVHDTLDSDKDVTGGMALKVDVSTRISSNPTRRLRERTR